MEDLGDRISELCRQYDGKCILMIDEVDKSSDNQIFLSFLGLLRAKYLARESGKDDTFQSVILAGVYDIKNLKLRMRDGEEAKYNSPWNVAADFPQKKDAWTREGFQEAVRLFLKEPNMLFDDMVKKLQDYPDLKAMLQNILFQGKRYSYEVNNRVIDIGVMFGIAAERDGAVAVANRLFEMKLYNLFLSETELQSEMFCDSAEVRNQFVVQGMLQMGLVMERFCQYFEEIYGDVEEKFLEEEGRRIFLMFLRPIINGNGNYYIEAQTRDRTRTDVIVDYRGRRFIIEWKLWRGNAYEKRGGERQLFAYLEYYGESTGYLLSFDFNKQKRRGIKEIVLEGKKIIEAVV